MVTIIKNLGTLPGKSIYGVATITNRTLIQNTNGHSVRFVITFVDLGNLSLVRPYDPSSAESEKAGTYIRLISAIFR
jgi:hypothetical protein